MLTSHERNLRRYQRRFARGSKPRVARPWIKHSQRAQPSLLAVEPPTARTKLHSLFFQPRKVKTVAEIVAEFASSTHHRRLT